MSVKKKYRGAGIAKRLLQVVLEYSKREKLDSAEKCCLVLTTIEFNFSAIQFYKKQGFKIINISSYQLLYGLLCFNEFFFLLKYKILN